jgi:hypothetical protein
MSDIKVNWNRLYFLLLLVLGILILLFYLMTRYYS